LFFHRGVKALEVEKPAFFLSYLERFTPAVAGQIFTSSWLTQAKIRPFMFYSFFLRGTFLVTVAHSPVGTFLIPNT